MPDKFNAAEWKNTIEKDIQELKKFATSVNNYLSIFEQWRRLPFNTKNGENNETNTRRTETKAKSTKSYGPTGSNPKSKKRNSGNVARKSGTKTKKLKR